jgi:predicted TIM-barrel fold metal-dependent hydrolase
MLRRPFVETHIHLHDLTDPSLEYRWLERGGDLHEAAVLGEYGAIRAERYWADDFIAETRFQNVSHVIHLQNATGPDPLAETRWLHAFHERLGVPDVVMSYCDLSALDARSIIEQNMEFDFFRGIRDPRDDDYLTNPDWEAGLAVLDEHGLILCDDPPIAQAAEAARLAHAYPRVTYCLDHALWPALREPGDFVRWRDGLRVLAQAPNTVIKISGLGMVDRRWTTDSIRERVLTCIETFGVERTIFGTNWPVDRLFSSYADVLDAYAEIIHEFSDAEQEALFGGNAKRIWRLGD